MEIILSSLLFLCNGGYSCGLVAKSCVNAEKREYNVSALTRSQQHDIFDKCFKQIVGVEERLKYLEVLRKNKDQDNSPESQQ